MVQPTLRQLIARRNRLRKALAVRTASAPHRRHLRASLAETDEEIRDTQMDILARLQLLEGAFRLRKRNAKLMWTRGHVYQGLKLAQKEMDKVLAKEKTYIDRTDDLTKTMWADNRKAWLSPRNTKFFSYVRRGVEPILSGAEVDAEDLMQMLMMGINAKGLNYHEVEDEEGNVIKQIPLVPLFQDVGFRSKRQKNLIARGESGPMDFVPIAKKWAQRRALNIIRDQARAEKRMEKNWGEEIEYDALRTDSDSWESEVPEYTGMVPSTDVLKEWGTQSAAWNLATAIFHTDTQEARDIRSMILEEALGGNSLQAKTMRTMFELLQEGALDIQVSGEDKPKLRQQHINEQIARRMNGKYIKVNSSLHNGWTALKKWFGENLGDVDKWGTKEELQGKIEQLKEQNQAYELRFQGVDNPKAKADLSAAHREQQATRQAIKGLRTQIESLQNQATSAANPLDVSNLEKAKKEQQAARRAVTQKRNQLKKLREEAKEKATLPKDLQKQLKKLERELERLVKAEKKVSAEYQAVLVELEEATRVTKVMTNRRSRLLSKRRKTRLAISRKKKEITELESQATPPKKTTAAITKAEGELKELQEKVQKTTAKVKTLQERVDAVSGTLGGPSPETLAELESAKALLSKARAAVSKKLQQVKDLKAKSKPTIPTEMRKQLTAARKALTAAKKAAQAAAKERDELQQKHDGYKRPPKRVKEALAAAKKKAARTKSQFTRKGNLLAKLKDEAEAQAVVAPRTQATITKADGELKKLRTRVQSYQSKVKGLEQRVEEEGAGGPDMTAALDEAKAVLAKSKAEQRKARAAVKAKGAEVQALKEDAESKAKPNIPTELRKQLTAARKALTAAKKAAKAAAAARDELQQRHDGYKRPPKKVKEALAAAKKRATSTRSQFTRKGNLLAKLKAEADQHEKVIPPKAQKTIDAAVAALKRLRAAEKRVTNRIKRETAAVLELEATMESGVGLATQQGGSRQEAIRNLEGQLATLEEKAAENKARIQGLEVAGKGGPLDADEKRAWAAKRKELSATRGQLGLIKMLDDLTVAGQTGYKGIRMARKMARRIVARRIVARRIVARRIVARRIVARWMRRRRMAAGNPFSTGAPPGGWTEADRVPRSPRREKIPLENGDILITPGARVGVNVFRNGKWAEVASSSTMLRKRALTTYTFDGGVQTVPAPDFTTKRVERDARKLLEKYLPQYLSPGTRIYMGLPGGGKRLL
jgi:colicin import membrane protein